MGVVNWYLKWQWSKQTPLIKSLNEGMWLPICLFLAVKETTIWQKTTQAMVSLQGSFMTGLL